MQIHHDSITKMTKENLPAPKNQNKRRNHNRRPSFGKDEIYKKERKKERKKGNKKLKNHWIVGL